jgi:hypothetical protein
MEAAANYSKQACRPETAVSLSICYTFHPEMNPRGDREPDGKISAMLMGEIPVAEIKAADLSKLLVEQSSHYLRDPEVMVDRIRSGEKNNLCWGGGRKAARGPIP